MAASCSAIFNRSDRVAKCRDGGSEATKRATANSESLCARVAQSRVPCHAWHYSGTCSTTSAIDFATSWRGVAVAEQSTPVDSLLGSDHSFITAASVSGDVQTNIGEASPVFAESDAESQDSLGLDLDVGREQDFARARQAWLHLYDQSSHSPKLTQQAVRQTLPNVDVTLTHEASHANELSDASVAAAAALMLHCVCKRRTSSM